MSLSINGHIIETDTEGYLINQAEWTEAIGHHIAHLDGMEMTDAHWEIVLLLRQFYQQFDLSPAMRPLVKYISQQAGKDKGNSIYLLKLFPPSPARVASKIAGLPKPANCL